MKKLFILMLLAATLFSCSSDDNTVSPPKVLQKIVFYRDSPNERQWNFSNGLLVNITYANGSVAEEFTYDAQKRLTKDAKYGNGVQTEVDIITYNADNTIKSVNFLPYNFNPTTNTYAYSYGSNFTIECKVNEDMLAVDFLRTGVNPGEYHMTYANGNMTSFEKRTGGATDILKNFHFSGTRNDETIYSAILAVARVKSLTDPSFFIDCQVSKERPDSFDKGPADSNHYNYGSIINTDGTLLEIGIEVLDSNNNLLNFYSFADYYYQ